VSNPPRTPAECLSTILLWLSRAVDAHYLAGRISGPLIILILNRIRAINHRFARLAARISAGKYVPRRPPDPPRQRAGKRPRGKNPLPQGFAWLLKLVPEAVGYRSQLVHLFRDPEMAALMAAAAAPLRRPLRSLCWMLGVRPPPILALPPPVRPKTVAPPAQRKRPQTRKPPERPSRPRYVFGLRYPPPLPDPA
jgi:hypothetical protein